MASSKRKKLVSNFSSIILQFMSGKGYLPLSTPDLVQRLRIPEQHEELFQEALQLLIDDGSIVQKGNSYAVEGSGPELVTGILRVHPRGFGFLQPDHPSDYSEDIFIPRHLTKNAVDGDSCEVAVNTEVVSEKGPEGRVVAILKRGRTHLAGTILRMGKDNLQAHVPILGSMHTVFIRPSEEFELRVGDRVILHVESWGDSETATYCTVSHYIGHISDPSCDITAAVEEFNIPCDFPHLAVEEARSYGQRVKPSDFEGREDFRDQETVTIDPDTAKDFDDAISLTKDKRGCYQLCVHIADVTHYVRPSSALDREALQRCNSTYFPGRCVPMIPPELSDHLCSLKPNVNRLAISVIMDFAPDGKLKNYRVARSVIRSQKRFSYGEAKEVLDGKRKSKHSELLHRMVELCGLLKKHRYARGSIEFALPEYAICVDE
ncbi:MAG: RNB domain-containing ribonuclease, partial [Chlamydiia bacterium]|nr:RNB domain-containing ribonuclease [Chlamydiia bacterium]